MSKLEGGPTAPNNIGMVELAELVCSAHDIFQFRRTYFAIALYLEPVLFMIIIMMTTSNDDNNDDNGDATMILELNKIRWSIIELHWNGTV